MSIRPVAGAGRSGPGGQAPTRHRPAPITAASAASGVSSLMLAPLSLPVRLLVLFACTLVVALIGLFDYLAGPFFSVSVFYLVPILVVTWLLDVVPGVLFCVLCTAAGVLADLVRLEPGPYPLAMYWDGVSSLAVYLFVTFVVVAFRAVLEREVELARTDALTGAANARSFRERAGLELSRALRTRRPITVAYIDVDRFKQVNDQFGHSAGDQLLRLITATIQRNLRASDVVARLGGDEFALLLPETAPGQAGVVMERVQSALTGAMQQGNWPATFSAGVVTFVEAPETVDDLIYTADQVMYTAKRGGKNSMRHVISPRES